MEGRRQLEVAAITPEMLTCWMHGLQTARHRLKEAEIPVSPEQTVLLCFVSRQGKDGCKQVDIWRHMKLSATVATGYIDRLERDGFVRRFPDGSDRRAHRVRLTNRGAAMLVEITRTLRDILT